VHVQVLSDVHLLLHNGAQTSCTQGRESAAARTAVTVPDPVAVAVSCVAPDMHDVEAASSAVGAQRTGMHRRTHPAAAAAAAAKVVQRADGLQVASSTSSALAVTLTEGGVEWAQVSQPTSATSPSAATRIGRQLHVVAHAQVQWHIQKTHATTATTTAAHVVDACAAAAAIETAPLLLQGGCLSLGRRLLLLLHKRGSSRPTRLLDR
jgi:hypothetical protein